MPTINVRRLAQELRESVLDVAWRQWHVLGAGVTASRPAASIVDPEALVLLSLSCLQDEPRLGDLLHGWASKHASLSSAQRMRNLAPRFPAAARAALVNFGRIALAEHKDLRWRFLADAAARGDRAWPRRERTRLATPRLKEPAALWLRLRLAIGVGVKADVLTLLLGCERDWMSVREIATATGYTPAAVRRALDDMVSAAFAQSAGESPERYRVEPNGWPIVLQLPRGIPRWCNWAGRFSLIAEFIAWEAAVRTRDVSPYAFAAYGRELLERHRPALGNFQRHFPPSAVAEWGSFTAEVLRDLGGVMREEA